MFSYESTRVNNLIALPADRDDIADKGPNISIAMKEAALKAFVSRRSTAYSGARRRTLLRHLAEGADGSRAEADQEGLPPGPHNHEALPLECRSRSRAIG